MIIEEDKEKITLSYYDYRNFPNFLKDSFKGSIPVINPFEFFRINKCQTENTSKLVMGFFQGKFQPIPRFIIEDKSFNSYDRFEAFTSRNEVNNLSLWGLACLEFLSYETIPRLGKELEIIQKQNPRDGRLDVVGFSKNQYLVFETKVTLANMLREGRYIYQVPEYIKECTRLIDEQNKELSTKNHFNIFILLGGKETDLYPSEHPDCTTGRVGNISSIFYDNVRKYNFKFISANALWALSALSEVTDKNYYWYKVLPEIFSNNEIVGLLSGGIVCQAKNNFIVRSFSL